MRILVMTPLSQRSVNLFVHAGVVHRPDLAALPVTLVNDEWGALRPHVVMVRASQAAALASVMRAMPPREGISACHVIVCGLLSAAPDQMPRELAQGFNAVTGSSWEQAEHEAFLLAEALCRPRAKTHAPSVPQDRGDVTLVGAGVVNLVTALRLRERGYAVTVYDRMADPLRSTGVPTNAGASFSGGDARIFSFNESRHHLVCPSGRVDPLGDRFRREVAQDGWLCRPFSSLAENCRRWVHSLEAVPSWAAFQYGNDIVRFNQDSDAAWRRLFSVYPELLVDAHHVGRLLRVYPSEKSLACGWAAEGEIGAVIEEIGRAELLAREPALADAVANGAVAGALKVRGFSLNLHRFGRNLVRLLQRLGVEFLWEQALDDVLYDGHGTAQALVLGGRRVPVRDCVISPGAYGHAIHSRLGGLAAIGAMVGMWVTLPNDGVPLSSPLKVRRRGFGSSESAQGANVVPARDASGRPVLHCSSGHGFVGVKPGDVEAADLPELARCVMETAEDLFPDKFRRARDAGLLNGPPTFCVRPWTPSGLGVLETQPTVAGGRLVLSGGHNTGGFAQAPAVADAVDCALAGKDHPMHTLYHPQRTAHVFGEAA